MTRLIRQIDLPPEEWHAKSQMKPARTPPTELPEFLNNSNIKGIQNEGPAPARIKLQTTAHFRGVTL